MWFLKLIPLALGLVKRIPGVSWLVGKAQGKGRLWTEYALIAFLIVAATLSITMWLQREKTEKALTTARGKITTLQQRVGAVEGVNQAQGETIQSLRDLRAIDARALSGLNDDYQRLNERDASVRKKITDLEKNNAQVRAYLDQPLPPELIQLLKGGTTGTRNPGRHEN